MAGKAPQQRLDDMAPAKVQAITRSLRELYGQGRPKTNEEVQQRVNKYFEFCENSSIRPGIESLCCALHITRQTLYRWSNGIDCDKERQEIVGGAKSFISAFLEQASLSGQVNPPVGIFLMKNWLGYKDTLSIEQSMDMKPNEEKPLDAQGLRNLMDENNLEWNEKTQQWECRYWEDE